MRHSFRVFSMRSFRTVMAGLALTAAVVGALGTGCDQNAQAAFRQSATGPIGDGVKTVMDGILSGIIAAIENAGDGTSGSSTNNSSTNNSSTNNSTNNGTST